MGLLFLFAGMSEIQSAVVCDTMGELSEALGEIDGEAVAEVMAFVVNNFNGAGNALGLGPLKKLRFQDENTSCVVAVRDEAIVAVYLEPGRPTTEIENKIESSDWVKAGDLMILMHEVEDEEGGVKPAPEEVVPPAATEMVAEEEEKEGVEYSDPF